MEPHNVFFGKTSKASKRQIAKLDQKATTPSSKQFVRDCPRLYTPSSITQPSPSLPTQHRLPPADQRNVHRIAQCPSQPQLKPTNHPNQPTNQSIIKDDSEPTSTISTQTQLNHLGITNTTVNCTPCSPTLPAARRRCHLHRLLSMTQSSAKFTITVLPFLLFVVRFQRSFVWDETACPGEV